MKFCKSVLIGPALLLTALNVQAEEKTLDAVVVTASRTETKQASTLASTTVITRADIEKSQASDVFDILSNQSGVQVARNGGPGSLTSVFLRGSNSNHALILIDGVRVNSATQGTFDLSQIPSSAIERIEIVRGPRASVWGSDALGGVIQIFTRRSAKAFVEAGVGSDSRNEIDAGIGIGEENYFGINAGYARGDGFSATNEDNFAFDADDDGFRNRHVNINSQFKIGTQTLNINAFGSNSYAEFDQGDSDGESRVAGMRLSGPLTDRWSHQFGINFSKDLLDTPAFDSQFGGNRRSADWLHTFAFDNSALTAGLSYYRENGFTSTADVDDFRETRNNRALFVTWLGEFGNHQLDLAARHDDNSQYGNNDTGHIAYGYRFNDAVHVRANVGQGFRAPNFNELYYPGFFGFFSGNPNLQPESSLNRELGLDWNINSQHQLNLSLYRNDIEQLICFCDATFSAINTERALIKGAELEYRFKHERFSLNSSFNWQTAINADTKDRLLRRAPRKAVISADWQLNSMWSIGADFIATAEREDFASRLPGFARWDLRINGKINEQFSIGLRAENMGDKFYELVDTYNTPGRSVMLNLQWTQR